MTWQYRETISGVSPSNGFNFLLEWINLNLCNGLTYLITLTIRLRYKPICCPLEGNWHVNVNVYPLFETRELLVDLDFCPALIILWIFGLQTGWYWYYHHKCLKISFLMPCLVYQVMDSSPNEPNIYVFQSLQSKKTINKSLHVPVFLCTRHWCCRCPDAGTAALTHSPPDPWTWWTGLGTTSAYVHNLQV